MKKVLILCTGNSCRSIMAEALINHHLSQRWLAYSAGVDPSVINPRAEMVMEELGISLDNYSSKSVEEFIDREDLDLVITVCDNAREACPIFTGNAKKIHIGFDDPADYNNEPNDIALPKFREVRDKIKRELLEYLSKEK
jgi:arsenate reductase (thioredoxin)